MVFESLDIDIPDPLQKLHIDRIMLDALIYLQLIILYGILAMTRVIDQMKDRTSRVDFYPKTLIIAISRERLCLSRSQEFVSFSLRATITFVVISLMKCVQINS